MGGDMCSLICQLSGKIDVFVSHDWPVEIYHHGDKEGLLRWKPFFRKEVMFNPNPNYLWPSLVISVGQCWMLSPSSFRLGTTLLVVQLARSYWTT